MTEGADAHPPKGAHKGRPYTRLDSRLRRNLALYAVNASAVARSVEQALPAYALYVCDV